MDKLELDYFTCQLNLDMDSSSGNYQCKTLLPSYLNSDGFQASSLYMRRWRRRQNRKLEMNQLEGGQQFQQQQHPSDVSDNCERHMLTNIPVTVTTDSANYVDVCTPTNSSSTVINNAISPGNYKKILIDRYLLSQSKSLSATNGNTSPFDEKMVSPQPEKKQCKIDHGNATRNSFRADLNCIDNISVECKKSNQGVLDTTEIANIQSIFESALHATTKYQLTKNENTNNQNFILSDNNPTNCKKRCNESNTLLPKVHSIPSEDNIQRQLSNQNSLLDNLIMQVINRNINSRISSIGKPHHFNVLDLIHTLLIRRGSSMNSDHQQRATAAAAANDTRVPLNQEHVSLLANNTENPSTPKIGLLSVLERNNSSNNLLFQKRIMKESLNDDKEQRPEEQQEQEEKSAFLPTSKSANTWSKDLFNDQNYLDLIQNLTRNHDFDESIVNPSLTLCNQPYTASSISSILSSFNLPTPNSHSPLPQQHQIPSYKVQNSIQNKSDILRTSNPLKNHPLDHEHLSGALISPSLSPLPPSSSSSGSSSSSCPSPSLQKYLKYIRSISTNTCHNNSNNNTVSAYPSPSSCTSTPRLSSPFIHNSSKRFAQFSESNSPTEDIIYSKMNNQGKNTLPPVLAMPLQQQQKQVQQDEGKSVQLMCNYNLTTSLTRHPSLSSINTTPKSKENNYLAEDEYPIGEQQHPCYPFVITSIASPTINNNNNNEDNKNMNIAQNIIQLSSVNTDEYQLKNHKSSSRNTTNSNKKVSKLLLSKRINSDSSKIKSNYNNNNNCMLTKASNKHNTNSTTTTISNNNNNSSDGNGSSASTSSQHNKNSNGSHVCTICSRQFSRSDMLVRHAHVHTGHRPFECTICGQAFSRSDHLSTHQRTHTGQRPYQCSLCYYSASRRDMITRHLRVHQRRGHIIPTSEGQGSTKLQFTTKTSQSH